MTTLTSQCQNPKAPDLCRLCLEKSSSLISLFDYEPLENPLHCPLLSKISLCLSVRITHEDKITTKVCQSCAVKVDEFYNFYNKATQSQKLLAQWEFELEVQRTSESTVKNDFNSVLDGSSEILDGALSLQEEEEGKENNFRKHHDLLKVVDGDSLSATFDDVDATTSGTGLDTDYLNIDQLGLLSQCTVNESKSTKVVNDGKKPDEKTSNLEKGISAERRKDDLLAKHDFSSFNVTKGAEKKFVCSVCHYKSTSSSNFKIHMMKHNKEYLIRCDVCGKGFYNRKFCAEHKQLKHSSEITIHKCDKCDKVYHSSSYLKQHLKTHSDYEKKAYLCETCGKKFLSWKGVKRHNMIVHLGSRYKCDICKKEVNSLQSLNNHKKTHSGEKSFVCKICGKGFIAMHNLVVHERVHSGEKPYKCDICDKSFTQCSTLKVHKRYHSGERPYPCSLCNKRFVTNTLMKVHEKTHK
ncbi:zinc finger protein 208-like isoform X3 [Cimex lectularius]|uniref:Zinc finger protein n=1 Tax=Cimex lectularius TaxID=79782 RepID=A0A8I6TN12_CIMLE|nr:zinc finger protein 208-like isoform X3 [Cimex lectularius]